METLDVDVVSLVVGVAIGVGLSGVVLGLSMSPDWRGVHAEFTVVLPTYVHPRIPSSECAWISEAQVLRYQAKGYHHVRHHETGGPCFAVPSETPRTFLMRRPKTAIDL